MLYAIRTTTNADSSMAVQAIARLPRRKALKKKTIRLTAADRKQAAKIAAATIEFIDLQSRTTNPEGSFDNKKRFSPSQRFDCCRTIRMPSAAFPFSLLVHARTATHVASAYGIDPAQIKSLKRAMERFEAENVYICLMRDALPAAQFTAFLRQERTATAETLAITEIKKNK